MERQLQPPLPIFRMKNRFLTLVSVDRNKCLYYYVSINSNKQKGEHI